MTPDKVHKTLGKYMLVDGFSHVVDLKKSNGSWFVDARDGKEYLDCYSMHAATPIGWNHPKLLAQADRLHEVALYKPSNSDCYTVQQAEFVETFASMTPDFKHHFYITGGALAVENALKAAFDWKAQISGFDKETDDSLCNIMDVIHFKHSFHGRSGYTLSLTNTTKDKTKYFPKFSWTRLKSPSMTLHENVEEIEKNVLDYIDRQVKNRFVAAVIIEPIQSEGGDNHFRKEFFTELRRLTLESQTLLIFDEVQTGLGMTGKTWCYEHFGTTPDLLCFGKKVQVCGFVSTDRINTVKNNVFKVSSRINSTWGGDLTDMVRSTIFMEIIKEDNLVQNAADVGSHFLGKLKEINGIKNVRGQGLIIAFDLADADKRDKFYNKLSEKVLALKCGQKSIRFRPHLNITKEEADYVVKCVKDITSQH